jgi:flagellar protein FlaG
MEIGSLPPYAATFVAPAQATLTPQERVEQRQLTRAVRAINQARLFGEGNELTFALERGMDKPVVRIIDKETKEVIRQIPPEYLLRLAETLDEEHSGE